ncbi:hypothetical protein CPC08DRAFT_401452 [Agrocybe pediades]|nr:hypothetical protein CPC08DRAFT_401452 [Agrocybe pediades]
MRMFNSGVFALEVFESGRGSHAWMGVGRWNVVHRLPTLLSAPRIFPRAFPRYHHLKFSTEWPSTSTLAFQSPPPRLHAQPKNQSTRACNPPPADEQFTRAFIDGHCLKFCTLTQMARFADGQADGVRRRVDGSPGQASGVQHQQPDFESVQWKE